MVSCMAVVALKEVSKLYPDGTLAVDRVSFELRQGEVHALLGENGAGKTTLMKILCGCLKPSSGTIYVDGRPVRFKSPADALKAGIGMVHQHFTLIPNMTVLENLKLGLIDLNYDEDALIAEAERLCQLLGFSVNFKAPIYTLSTGEKQRVEILRLLLRRVRVLIFDEPTSSLCGPEVDRLLELLKLLASRGSSVVLITHKVREALKVSDRITILRRGRVVARLSRESVRSEEQLIELMVGERLVNPNSAGQASRNSTPLLVVRNLTVKDDHGFPKVRNVSFEVYPGEIFGIVGIEGSGQRELVEAITGLRTPAGGRVVFNNVDGRDVKLGYVPSDRLELGVAPSLDVAKNAVLSSLNEPWLYKRGFLLDSSRIRGFAEKVVHLLGVKTPSLSTPVKYLSGGNIQKLVVGRELAKTPSLLIVEQPTAGLDAKSASLVKRLLLDLARSGVGVLLVSPDMDEVLELSDRIAAFRDGRIVGVFERGDVDAKALGKYLLSSGGA